MDLHFSFQKYRGSCDRTKIKLNKKGKGIISAPVTGCLDSTCSVCTVPFPHHDTTARLCWAPCVGPGLPCAGSCDMPGISEKRPFWKRWLPFPSATKVSALAGGMFTIGPTTTAVGVQRLGVGVLHWLFFARKTQSGETQAPNAAKCFHWGSCPPERRPGQGTA